jgi:hypothetical protein
MRSLGGRPSWLKSRLEVQFKVHDIVNPVSAVDETHMSSDEDVTVTPGRRGQSAIVVGRDCMNPVTHIAIEHHALPKLGFILGREPVAVP